MAQVHDELVRLVVKDQGLFDAYFKLGPVGKAMWECAAPRWHGIARADMFLTAGGPAFCELNSDTPSGQAEAVTLSHMFADCPGRDPNQELEARFCAYVAHAARGLGKGHGRPHRRHSLSHGIHRRPRTGAALRTLAGGPRRVRGAGLAVQLAPVAGWTGRAARSAL
jgi:hypothetical protein